MAKLGSPSWREHGGGCVYAAEAGVEGDDPESGEEGSLLRLVKIAVVAVDEES